MLVTLSTPIFSLFIFASLAAFFFPFLKNKLFKQLSLKSFSSTAPIAGAVLVAFSVLFGLGNLFSLNTVNYIAYFALGFAALYALNNIGLTARLTGVVLLFASLILTLNLSGQVDNLNLVAIACGAMAWKLIENLFWEARPVYDDIVPALVWLLGVYWIRIGIGGDAQAVQAALLAGGLSVMMLLRLFETPFLSDDKVYLKRLMLSATGGLGFLIVITKLIVNPQFAQLAILFGGGLFVSYLLQELEEREKTFVEGLYALLLIGGATLVAYRFFGTFGLLILAVTSQIGKGELFAHYAGLFWIARVMLQTYIVAWVANVTGINTMHPYVGAALYGGMLLVVIMSLTARDVQSRRLYLLAFLASGSLLPIFSNYFLHEEATASLIQAACVAAVLVVVLAPVIYQSELPKHGNIILLPTMLSGFGSLANGLIPIGNTVTTTTRITSLAYSVACLLVLSVIIGMAISRKSGGKPVNVAGN